MKIILSHSQKQHSYRLATGLKKYNYLKRFFTSIFFFNNSFIFKILKKTKYYNILKKRNIDTLEKKNISRTFFPEICYHIIKLYDKKYAAYILDRVHDNIVALKLANDYDAVIGYERQSLKTFKKAKKNSKITILDLASIHPYAQKELNEKYNNITTGFEKSNVVNLNRKVKIEEYKYTDYVIALSEYAKQTCIQNNFNPNNIYTVKLGIDTKFFFQKEDYKNDKFKILFVAGVRYWKGIKDLIEAFKELNLNNSELIIIGTPGDATDYVKSNISDNIKYIPHLSQDKLRDYYQAASVFILASYMDSWGQVVCEAMSCGTTVIVSKSTGSSDIIENGENGFIIDTGDKEQLKDKIQYLSKNQHLVESMGRKARESIEELNWNNYYSEINSIIKDIKKRENI